MAHVYDEWRLRCNKIYYCNNESIITIDLYWISTVLSDRIISVITSKWDAACNLQQSTWLPLNYTFREGCKFNMCPIISLHIREHYHNNIFVYCLLFNNNMNFFVTNSTIIFCTIHDITPQSIQGTFKNLFTNYSFCDSVN